MWRSDNCWQLRILRQDLSCFCSSVSCRLTNPVAWFSCPWLPSVLGVLGLQTCLSVCLFCLWAGGVFQTQVGQACTAGAFTRGKSPCSCPRTVYTPAGLERRRQTVDLVFARIVSDQHGQPGQPCAQAILKFTCFENKLMFAFHV